MIQSRCLSLSGNLRQNGCYLVIIVRSLYIIVSCKTLRSLSFPLCRRKRLFNLCEILLKVALDYFLSVFCITESFLALKVAFHCGGTFHRDVSHNNAMISKTGRGCLNDWYRSIEVQHKFSPYRGWGVSDSTIYGI